MSLKETVLSVLNMMRVSHVEVILANSFHVHLTKCGAIVWGHIGDGAYLNVSAGSVIMQLPSGYRPATSNCEFVDTYGKKRIRIQPDGNVIAVEGVNSYVRGSFNFIVGG